MALKLTKWDIQDHIKTPERQAGFLEAMLEEGNADDVIAALGEIARARGATEFSRASGVSRETIYKQFRPGGNPRLATLGKALKTLGLELRLTASPKI